MSSIQYRISIFAVLLFSSGCFSSGSPQFEGKLEPVTGTVLVDGKPYAGLEITFLPAQGTDGTGASAITDSQGQFTLAHRSGQPGIEQGTYKVLFSLKLKADGSSIQPSEDAALVGQEKIPARYQNFDMTPEQSQVSLGGGTFEFKLKSRK